MLTPIPHPSPDSIGSTLAALAILYHGSLAKALAEATKRAEARPSK